MSGLQPGPSLGDGLLEPTINTQRPAGILAQVNEYKIISELGKGAFGLVYVVERDIVDNPASTTRRLENDLENNKTKNENRFAMKVLTETPHQKTFRRGPGSTGDSKDKKLMREIAILKKLNHPHLVKLYAAIRESVPPYSIFIILEYIEAGPIMKAINSENGGSPRFVNPILKSFLGESLASRCFRGVLSALSYLHRNKIAHRDLKPDNILVDFDWCVKVTDFGVSEQFTTPSTRGMCKDTAGTWPFWSPEMCSDDDEGDGSYGAYKADVWAAGVCLWCFVYGALPFWGDTPTMLFESIAHETPAKPGRRSPQLEELLDAMLQKDPDLRPSPEECEKLTWLQQHSTAETELALTAYSDSVDHLLHEVDEHELANAFTPGSLRFSESIDKKLRKWKRRASHSVQQRKSDVMREHSCRAPTKRCKTR
jgi:[calcium/calmodulin-dependent protein kinase] kinase